MKMKFHSQRGQALILIALGAIGLFGIAGLAIDGSAKFSDRRHAQNAADTAAIAGALSAAREESKGNGVGGLCPPVSGSPTYACAEAIRAAKDRAYENGYTDNKTTSIVEVNIPPKTGTYSKCNDVRFKCEDYVQVIITSHVNTYFARIVGINQTHNVVEAVASKISANNHFNFGGNAVVALSPKGCALMGMGNINVVIDGGGLYSNSSDPSCSFQGGTCASVLDVNNEDGSQGAINMVGGYNYGGGCQPQADMVAGAGKQLPFPPPYEEIAEPIECTKPGTNVTGNPASVTLSPGYYSALPPKPNIGTTILKPGVYCIGTTLSLNASEIIKVEGTFGTTPGVFLYFKPGGSFTFNGGSGIQLWGIFDKSSPYFGYLMYVAPNYASGTPVTCKINGHSGDPLTGVTGDTFLGTIYAPYCDLTLSGTSDPNGFQTQIIAYNVKFAGGANVHLTYNDDNSPVWNIPLQVGLTK